ncbi:hypothetical protein CEQ21_07165 (plasmid) [Niallia circulans]|uniref:Uncharacterized protein n=1 Tax=Niallia circulans TaxID=1397 RepID=A0A553SQR8_NIACI|nr:hypothetical protein [Niallia circulans]TRZ39333.1 hypothetical protein CEQ21_07165 [Niallia circulans]
MKNNIYVGEGFPSFPVSTYTISRTYLLLTTEVKNMYLDSINFSIDVTDIKDNKIMTTTEIVEADGRELSLSTLSKEAIKVMRTERMMKWEKQVDKEVFYHLLDQYKDNLLAVSSKVIETVKEELK